MLRWFIGLMVLGGLAFNATADVFSPRTVFVQTLPTKSQWDIASVKLEEVADLAPAPTIATDMCDPFASRVPNGLDVINWGEIITIGEKIWGVIQQNKPVITLTAPVVHALPRGLTCWTDLEHWQPPFLKSYKVTYTNGLGMDAVVFGFRLQFNYGGGNGPIGQYIANATVMPDNISAIFGYDFEANAQVGNAINLGTSQNPLAGLELDLKWSVHSLASAAESSINFFMQGDGQQKVTQ